MRTYLKNIKHITSLMAFIAALLIGMSFAAVSNAAVVTANPMIGNSATVQAVVPPLGVKTVESTFVRPAFSPFFNRPAFTPFFRPAFNPFFRPAFNPFFNRPFINPFVDVDVDFEPGFVGD